MKLPKMIKFCEKILSLIDPRISMNSPEIKSLKSNKLFPISTLPQVSSKYTCIRRIYKAPGFPRRSLRQHRSSSTKTKRRTHPNVFIYFQGHVFGRNGFAPRSGFRIQIRTEEPREAPFHRTRIGSDDA